jgi:hypothetical protein
VQLFPSSPAQALAELVAEIQDLRCADMLTSFLVSRCVRVVASAYSPLCLGSVRFWWPLPCTLPVPSCSTLRGAATATIAATVGIAAAAAAASAAATAEICWNCCAAQWNCGCYCYCCCCSATARWETLIDPVKPTGSWSAGVLASIVAVEFIPCRWAASQPQRGDFARGTSAGAAAAAAAGVVAGGGGAAVVGNVVGPEHSSSLFEAIPAVEFGAMRAELTALKAACSALKQDRAMAHTRKKGSSAASEARGLRGSASDVLAQLDYDRGGGGGGGAAAVVAAAGRGGVGAGDGDVGSAWQSDDAQRALWVRQEQAMDLMLQEATDVAARAGNAPSSGSGSGSGGGGGAGGAAAGGAGRRVGVSVGGGGSLGVVFSSLSALKSSFSSMTFPWSFWESWTSALGLPQVFMKTPTR